MYSADAGRLGTGFQVLEWDGKDTAGRTTGSGVYFYRVVIDGQATIRKLVRLR